MKDYSEYIQNRFAKITIFYVGQNLFKQRIKPSLSVKKLSEQGRIKDDIAKIKHE